MNYITMTRKSGNHCFNLIKFHQQCIVWSPPLKVEPATTECRARTLPLSYWSTWHTSNAKLTCINCITMTRKSGNHCVRHTEPLNNCFNLIKFHQQCIVWSPPLKVEPATTECRPRTLPLSYWSTWHTSNAKLTSHGNCTAI